MSSDMDDSTTQLADLSDHRPQHHHRHHYHHHRGRTPVGEIGDDECSTDSGCSSGGSTGSGKRLSRHGSGELERRLCRSSRSPRTQHCYLDRLRERSTRSQERVSSIKRSSERTLSPEDVKSLSHGGVSSSSYSSSPSDAHSSSDSDSLKRSSTTETLRRAFQSLKITSSKWKNNKEKKHAKKSPKRILRSPVPYMYVRGLSGLPTQRVPRNSGGLP